MLRRWRLADTERIERQFAEADALAMAGNQERARDHYAKLAKRLASAPEAMRPHRGVALLREGETILAMGNFSEAMACFREAAPLLADPTRQLPRWLLRQFAEERMQSEWGDLTPLFDFLQATAIGAEPGTQAGAPATTPARTLTGGVEAGAEAEAASRALAWLHQQCLAGPPEAREAAARAAMTAMPASDWPVLALTAVLRQEGRVAEAETTLASAAPHGSGDVWFRWGIQLSTLQRYSKAVSVFDETLRRAPGAPSPWSAGPTLYAETLLFRGLARQQLGKSRLAGNDLRAASQAAPRDPRIHYSLGRLAVELGADDEARKHFTTALTVRSSFAVARLGLALLQERAGRPAEAVADYQAALRLDPTSRPARVRLGAVVLAAGRREEAEALLLPEMTESHWGAIATFHYGLARLRANDPNGALETWQRLSGSDIGPWTAVARDRMARSRLAADPVGARRLWQRAAADAPDIGGYRIALREAALREAAQLVLTGRDRPADRDAARAALAIAAAAAEPDAGPDAPNDPATGIRAGRLRAVLDLLVGSTKDAAGLLDPAASLLDRCHLAAAALTTGRAEQAEQAEQAQALLSTVHENPVDQDSTGQVPTDQDPDCDPALARLRALLAERAADWPEALRWHQRSLDNAVPAHGPPPGTADAAAEDPDDDAVDMNAQTVAIDIRVLIQTAARTAGPSADGARQPHSRSRCSTVIGEPCPESAIADCGACGREGCATHLYHPSGATTFRCARCAGPALLGVLECARRAGTPDPAERILTSWAEALRDSPLGTPIRRGLAMLRAEAGDLGGALAGLPVEAVRERVAILIRRAAAAIGRDEPFRAIDDLREAIRLEPGQPQAAAALEALAEHEARRHAAEGRLQEAFDSYLALLRDDPTHPRLLHALGLTSYRLATATARGTAAATATAQPEQPEYWAWAIGCLVAALHTPDLSGEVVRGTGRPAERSQIAGVRDGLMDRLRKDVREADASLDRTGDEPDCWEVRFGIEVAVAEILSRAGIVRIPVADGGDRLLVAGPTLDRLLRRQPETPGLAVWREHVDGLRVAGPDADDDRHRVAGLFGRNGPQHHLFEEGRYAAAAAALIEVPHGERDAAWTRLLRQALAMQGKGYHQNQEWRAALETMARAASLFPDGRLPAALTEIAGDAGLRAARALLRADTNDERHATDLLESAAALAPNFAALRVDLASAHARRAWRISDDTMDHATALDLVRKALAVAPDAPLARQVLDVVAARRADELARPGPDDDLLAAVDLWRELIAGRPDPGYQAGLARALLLLARSAAVAGDSALALERTADALRATDPTRSGDAVRDAPRRLAILVANHVTEDLGDSPFDERADLLRAARSYFDFPDLRALILRVWRDESAVSLDARRYTRCAMLLEEALTIAGEPEDVARLHGELAVVYRADAVRALEQNWHLQARALITLAVVHAPEDAETLALHARINTAR